MDGVFKLTAVRDQGTWKPAIKISETPEKIPNPGNKHLWRVYDRRNKATADFISLEDENPQQMDPLTLHHPTDHTTYRSLRQKQISHIESLLVDVLREGTLVYELPPIDEMRKQRIEDLDRLDPGVRRIMNPHIYHVSLTPKLWELKQSLIAASSEDYTQN